MASPRLVARVTLCGVGLRLAAVSLTRVAGGAGPVKILQLLPPEGWRAVLVDVGSRRLELHDLCAWALVEEDDGARRMVGMIVGAEGPDPYPADVFPKYSNIGHVLFMYSPPHEQWDERETERALLLIEQREPAEWQRERLRRERLRRKRLGDEEDEEDEE